MPTNIKTHIKSLELLNFENIDDDYDNYVDATVRINHFKVSTYSDYIISGYKTGGQLNVTISLGSNILNFENEYDFIPDRHNKNDLDTIYQSIKTNAEQSKVLSKMQVESGIDELKFEGFFKLLCCIPKIFNGYVY